MEKIPKLDLKSLSDPGSKYKLGLRIGGGVGGDVFEAVESETGKKVAIKTIELKKETENEIKQEYQVLKMLSANENFPEFYEIYLKKGKDNIQKVWLVMEFCEGGTATDFARKLEQDNKNTIELYVAYIMRETIKAVIHLHENEICHRDIRGSNILLTADGKVKLVDYGISKRLEKSKKMKTRIGSPSWLAPEVIAGQHGEDPRGYDKKADVWAIGITAIELGDGQAPFEDMHPARALFQIVQNPPPSLRRPSDWSRLYCDFISECLVKDPENRPFVQELLAHTFFEPVDAEENLQNDLKTLLEQQKDTNLYKKLEVQVRNGFLKIEQQFTTEKILQEDLAALREVSEDSVLSELHERFKKKEFQTFVGDILLILNPNKNMDVYGEQYHKKYRFKGKSENAPHVYAVADSAYRDVFHHEKQQQIIFAGETGAGKTFNMMHAIHHLLFLGQGLRSTEKIKRALDVIQTMGNASTLHNLNSTRHVLRSQLTFTNTGKVSGGIFRVFQLEKERVTSTAKNQSNFHLFYYFYEAIKSENATQFYLDTETSYKLLKSDIIKKKNFALDKYNLFENNLRELDFEEHRLDYIKNILAAIILLGEVEFVDDEDGNGTITSPEIVKNVADLLDVDHKKLSWALVNYCFIMKGEATMRRNSKEEAEEAKNVLAKGLYTRLVDWIVNTINEKLSVYRVVYGDRHIITLLDLYGFECYKRNTLDQLFVNTLNEQLQFHYNQKIFAWDKQTAEEEGISIPVLDYNDNKEVIDLIMGKPNGLLHKIDEATRNEDSSSITESLPESNTSPIFAETMQLFSINHYTGKITYDASNMIEKNRDFLPPELIDTMRLSENAMTKELFSSLLTKSGNLSVHPQKEKQEKTKDNEVVTNPHGQYSQSRQMRTAATTFRGTCVDLLKSLTINEFGVHFVRCLRTDLSDKPESFHPEVVRQQLQALGVVNTVLTTQQGYSYNVSHTDFIRRYKFIAFDFDENVEETKENCRLLLLRLKLEGWTMGKTKVFLKYYNKEYLSRMYETQIKKIIKVQSMMRAFMARRKLYTKIKKYQVDAGIIKLTDESKKVIDAASSNQIQPEEDENSDEDSNVVYDNLNESQIAFIRPWYKRWRTKTIFQVLLLYRADRLQALSNFCIQVHIYNNDALDDIKRTNFAINSNDIDWEANPVKYLPLRKPIPYKLPFNWESFILKNDTSDYEPQTECDMELLEPTMKADEGIEKPQDQSNSKTYEDKEVQTSLNGKNQEELCENPMTIEDSTNQAESTVNNTPNFNSESNTVENVVSSTQENFTNSTLMKTPPEIKLLEENILSENPKNEIPLKLFQDDKPSSAEAKKSKSQKDFQTSLKELEEKFRQNINDDDDDEKPPFNFRSMLRKTSFPTISNTSIASQNKIKIDFTERRKALTCIQFNKTHQQSENIVTELVPGILIHGKIADL